MKFTIKTMLAWLVFTFCLASHGDGAFSVNNQVGHHHMPTCEEVTSPYKRVADYFQTGKHVYFPGTYREKVCKQVSDANKIATCAGGLYHCITRYDKKQFLQIPMDNLVDMSKWDTATIAVAIGCECLT